MDQELKAFLEERFASIDERFASMDQRFEELREDTTRQIQEFREETAQRFDQVDHRLEKVDTDVRRSYVLIEGLHGTVQLVAEGVTNVSEQLQRYREEVSQEFEEVKSLNRLSYQDLDDRVRRLRGGR